MKYKIDDFKFNEDGQMIPKYDEETGDFVLPEEALQYMPKNIRDLILEGDEYDKINTPMFNTKNDLVEDVFREALVQDTESGEPITEEMIEQGQMMAKFDEERGKYVLPIEAFEMTDPVLDTYINTISDLFKARTDPAQQEEYYYMMLANAGYDYEKATEILDEYYKDKCPFGIKNEIKQQIEKDNHRPWPMLEDVIWDNMMYKNEKQRNSLQSIIDVLTSEALYKLGVDYKGDDNNE